MAAAVPEDLVAAEVVVEVLEALEAAEVVESALVLSLTLSV